MADIKKIVAGDHLPSIGDGRFPVYSAQFNALIESLTDGTATNISLGSVSLGDGSVSSPAIHGSTTTDTGLYFGTDVINFATGGVKRADFDANGDFNLVGGRGMSSNVSNARVPFIKTVAQDDITAGTGGAIPITNYYTTINTDAGGDNFTLADGDVIGQLKRIQLIADGGGDAVITPSNLSGGTTIRMPDAGGFAVLQWDGTNWVAIELGNAADGVSLPNLS